MKMNAKALAPLAIVAAFGLGTLAPHAQTPGSKVGFVDVPSLMSSVAGFKEADDLDKKYQGEFAALQKQAQDIQAKGAAATAADKDKLTQLSATYNAKMKDYEAQVPAKFAPIEAKVDKALNDYAKANGFSVIMSRGAAAQSGLVVYADDTTNLTEAVKKTIK